MFVLFFVFGRLFVFNWSTFPLAASERKFLNTWTWQPYLKKLNWIRRLVLCDWNCVVTFHQRSCLIPYPIDGKVSRHQFLPHHFPGLLRVWGWTKKLLIVQSNYKFTNLFLAIQCVVLSLHTIFFLKAPAKDWNKVKQVFFRMWFTRRVLNLRTIIQRMSQDGIQLQGQVHCLNRTREKHWFIMKRDFIAKKTVCEKMVRSWNELLCADRKSNYLEETEINSNCFSIVVDSRHFAELWRKGRAKAGLWPNIYL